MLLVRGGGGDGIFLVLESFFQSIDALEEGLENVCFRAALFWNCVWRECRVVSYPDPARSCGMDICGGWDAISGVVRALTINAWALEDLAGLAAGTQAIAFDLEKQR